MIPPWVSEWVGIPYVKKGRSVEGADCFGLYAMLLKERHGIEIDDPYCTIAQAIRSGEVARQLPQYKLVSAPSEGDAILLRERGFPIHLGYCINRDMMLHADPRTGSVVERWNGSKWKNRVIGVYRHASNPDI